MNESSLMCKPRGYLPVPFGWVCRKRGCCREALGLPALRQVGMCCVCAKCSPAIHGMSSCSAFHGFSESALWTKVWVCFHPKGKKEIPHRKCLYTLISTLQSVLTQWRNSTELNPPFAEWNFSGKPPKQKCPKESLCPCESPQKHLSRGGLLCWRPRVVFLSISVQALNQGMTLDTTQAISLPQKCSK